MATHAPKTFWYGWTPVILGLVLMLTAAGPANAASELQFLTCEEPPTNYLEDGKVTGITTDIVRELARRTGASGPIKLLPWARAYETALHTPNVILFTAGKTKARAPLFNWIGPIMIKRWVVYARKDDQHAYTSLDDLRAVKHIAVLRDDARGQLLAKEGFTNLIRVNSHEQGIKMLYHHRADLYPSSDIEAPFIAQRAGIPFTALRPVYGLKTIKPHIIVSKGTPPPVLTAWRRAWQAMVEDGTLEQIARLWAAKLHAPFTVRDGVIALAPPRNN